MTTQPSSTSTSSLQRQPAATAARAFTLVELLVVIGIIAVLVAMLLPALNRTRENARKVACASNFRQVGQMTAMYHNDNRGFFPSYWIEKPPPGMPWPYDGIPRQNLPEPRLVKYANGEPDAVRHPIFICPSSEGRPQVMWDGDESRRYGGMYAYYGFETTYFWNQELMGWGDPSFIGGLAWYNGYYNFASVRVTQVKEPTKTPWASEGVGARLDPFYTYDFIAWFRHGGGPANIANRDSTSALWDTSTDALGTGIGVNVLFVDGHVEWLGFSDFHPWICSYWRSDTVAARRFNWR